MIKLWLLIWYFTRSDRPKAGNAPSWYKDEINRSELLYYLSFKKHFRENWRATIRRYYYFFGGKQPLGTTEHGMKWIREQHKEINDLIDEAITKDYLIIAEKSVFPSKVSLTINWKGRRFIKLLPFIEANAKEYNYFATIVASFLLGIGGTVLYFFWNNIIEYLIK